MGTKRASPKSMHQRGLETKEGLFKKYGLNGKFDRNTVVDYVCRTGLKPSSRGRINTIIKYLIYQKHIRPADNGKYTVWYRDKKLADTLFNFEGLKAVKSPDTEVTTETKEFSIPTEELVGKLYPYLKGSKINISLESTPLNINFVTELGQLLDKYFGGT